MNNSSKSSSAAERFSIFEKVALERLQAASDSTKPASFLPLPVRLTAIAAIAIAGLGVLWSIVARVPVQLNGTAAILPVAGIRNLIAPTSGFLRYQVSGLGPNQLSSEQRQRNEIIARFWTSEYLSVSGSILSESQLRELARAVLTQNEGQPLLLYSDGEMFFDNPLPVSAGGDEGMFMHFPEGSFPAEWDEWEPKTSYPAGTLIAHIHDPLADEMLNSALLTKLPTAAIQAERQSASIERARELESLNLLQKKQEELLKSELRERQSLYERYRELWKKGYLPGTQLLEEKTRIVGIEEQLLANKSTALSTDGSRKNEIQQSREAQLSNIDARSQLESKIIQYLEKTGIFSPKDGFYLLNANFKNETYVNAGDTIFNYMNEAPALPKVLPVFLDSTAAQQANEGMKVLLTPKGISRAEFGGIPGKVVSVNRLPLTNDGLLGIVGSRALVSAISELLPTRYMLSIELEQAEPQYCKQALSRRCYRWSSGRLPPHPVRLATLADVQITADYRRPIEFILPAINRALGLVVDNK